MTENVANQSITPGEEEEETLEEKCQRLMQYVVKMRVVYPAHIQKINREITKHNMITLDKRLNVKSEFADEKKQTTALGDRLMRQYRELEERDRDLRKKQMELDSLAKIEQQFKNDMIGIIVREGIDSNVILERAKIKLKNLNKLTI